MDKFSFERTHLAVAYCDSLEGRGIANATSGLFLAGPRRVGKSTFLKDNLIPEGKKRDWVTVYVDLWANKNADPASLITEAIKASIARHKNKLAKLTQNIKLDKINIMGALALDFSKPGLPDNMTLTDALRLLGEVTGKPTLLLIDEAQHALSTKEGLNAMFAIKSARDQINSNHEKTKLMLVFTGSNRDKLAHLVLKKDQPFFGSEVTAFPLLGKEYTDAFTQWINKSLAKNNQFTEESMWQAFKLVGHRPEILRHLVAQPALGGEASDFAALLEQDAFIWHSRIWEEFESDFNILPPLQQAILEVLINAGRAWAPFSEEAMNAYQGLTHQTELSITAVQSAIQYLRDRGFIWQSGRGAYALEDESFGEWLKHRKNTYA